MKKTFAILLVILSIQSFAQKNVIGLSNEDFNVLVQSNPNLSIDLDKSNGKVSQYFNNISEAQNYIDSIKNVINQDIDIPERTISIGRGENQRAAACGCGDYVASAGSAGLFSSFNLSFNYCDGNVSNANIGASGLQIGWTLGNTSSSFSGLYACSNSTATFSIGVFSWTQIVRIMWHFNPNSCTLYYMVSTGPCGTVIGY